MNLGVNWTAFLLVSLGLTHAAVLTGGRALGMAGLLSPVVLHP